MIGGAGVMIGGIGKYVAKVFDICVMSSWPEAAKL
jgi:hypothetical protein